MNSAYHQTVFQALPEELPSSFCVITAWNPDGEADLPGRNRQRDQKLADRLETLGLPRVRITGMSPDEAHAEPGWAITCSLEEGLALGREFRQEGIFRVEGGELFLLNSDTGSMKSLGSFVPRLRDPRKRLLFTVHVSAPPPRALFSPTDDLEVRLRAAKRFHAFCITEAETCVGSETSDTFLITIVTDRPDEVLGLAKDLLVLFRTDEIGVSHNGISQRVTTWSDPEFLLRVWGI